MVSSREQTAEGSTAVVACATGVREEVVGAGQEGELDDGCDSRLAAPLTVLA